ncbi:HD-GYP domain-containing protein [Pseudomarimonas arenosa]|uniref:DUF3391 domain-containing protein n=1 Tax=Pseudomarimonas arenosa TaxID=2774145 RepID=A0AAW3ZNU0_9GAMM|nr:HD-GYP domain-containing protein [Pseudomarimonas arenosa]MBD8527805.1 DUF3391 domain-containing protein [Pseudomarimonas arenosa]
MGSEKLPMVDVDRLQIGMYVVLDLGWRKHPFAFNSFTIKTEEQLTQLRALGPRQLRYCPERSIQPPLPVAELRAEQVGEGAGLAPEIRIEPTRDTSPARRSSDRPPSTPLERQQAELARVEAEFTHAARSHQRIIRQINDNPVAAAQATAQLAQSMLEWIGELDEVSIRMLDPRIGDQLSGHEVGVTALAILLARHSGFSHPAMKELVMASLLHDMGKAKIPAFLHEDNGRLTEFERVTYRRHVELGVELAERMDLPWSVMRGIAEHHEHVDGSGFPAGLRGEQMTTAGRVLAVVNRYQNLIAPLHAELGLTPYQALRQMYAQERAHFDPVMLPRFIRIMGVYPPGSLVELSDYRMAIVVGSRPGMSLTPKVQIVEHPDDYEPSLAIDIEPERGLSIRRSVDPSQLNARWAQRARRLARTALFLQPLQLRLQEPPAELA